MALTKVGKEGVVGLDNSADATAITIDSSERVMIGTTTEGNLADYFQVNSLTYTAVNSADAAAAKASFTDVVAIEYGV